MCGHGTCMVSEERLRCLRQEWALELVGWWVGVVVVVVLVLVLVLEWRRGVEVWIGSVRVVGHGELDGGHRSGRPGIRFRHGRGRQGQRQNQDGLVVSQLSSYLNEKQ